MFFTRRIDKLEQILCGDGHNNPGLVRRMDKLEDVIGSIQEHMEEEEKRARRTQGWLFAIFICVLGVLVERIIPNFHIIVP